MSTSDDGARAATTTTIICTNTSAVGTASGSR